jgi:hypothetical protein
MIRGKRALGEETVCELNVVQAMRKVKHRILICLCVYGGVWWCMVFGHA